MKVSIHRKRGKSYFYYKCLLKEKSKGMECNTKNLKGELADQLVMKEISKISYPKKEVYQHLSSLRKNAKELIFMDSSLVNELERRMEKYHSSIHNLTLQLAENPHSGAAQHIINQIEEFDMKIKVIKKQIQDFRNEENSPPVNQENISFLLNLIRSFSSNVHHLTCDEKKFLVRDLISSVSWDGELLEVDILKTEI